jgi:hypothetical protein
MKVSSMGREFKIKLELLQNFELLSFELTRFHCISGLFGLVLISGKFQLF